MYSSSKTYGHDLGFSCCFRQWRAGGSRCSQLHGYSISVQLNFEGEELDGRFWVIDFGGLRPLKEMLEDTFDHKTIVAEDDPHLNWFIEAQNRGIANLVILPAVGCEKFAEYVYKLADQWLTDNNHKPRVRLHSVRICEHGANSATYHPKKVRQRTKII